MSVRSFVDIKMRCNFCLNFFFISLTVLELLREKNKSAFFSRGDITLSNQIMARKKNSFVLRMNYSTCTNFFRIFWICGLPNLPCESGSYSTRLDVSRQYFHLSRGENKGGALRQVYLRANQLIGSWSSGKTTRNVKVSAPYWKDTWE